MDIKTPYIWRNGEYINWDDANDHNLTHALHYGSGAFEGIRFYPTSNGPKIFRLDDHIDRLYYSANLLELDVPYTKEEIKNITIELIKKCEVESGYIRPIIYYGTKKMGLYPKGATSEFVISAWKWGKYLADKAIDVKISKYARIDPTTCDMNAKLSGVYYNSVLVSLEVHNEGFDEGLLLSTDGNIAEGPGENVFFIKGNEIYTPATGTILPGITRDSIKKIVKDKLGITVIEEKITPERLKDFDEAFFTGTAAEVTPIGSITYKGEKIAFKSYESDSMTRNIEKLYKDVVTGNDPDYLNWLS